MWYRKVILSLPIGAALLAPQWALSGDSACPTYPEGVHRINSGKLATIIVTATSTPLSQEEGSYAIAESEARIAAKRILSKTLYPDDAESKLVGVVVTNTCRKGGVVYATIEYNPRNAKKAIKTKKMMSRSLKENPTPIRNTALE